MNKAAAELALDELEKRWGAQYPIVASSLHSKGERTCRSDVKYPQEIRLVIYTTNVIEAGHRQFRKLTKAKSAFPNENSLMRLLYVGTQNASAKGTMSIQNWNLTLSQLAIYFEGRLDGGLEYLTD